MAQKVNPIANRLRLNREFNSCWFSNYYYSDLLSRDLFLHQYFTRLKNHFDIHRTEPKHPFRVSLYVIGADLLTPVNIVDYITPKQVTKILSKKIERKDHYKVRGARASSKQTEGASMTLSGPSKFRQNSPELVFFHKKQNKEFRQLLFRLPRKMKELVRYKFRRRIIKRGCIFQNKPEKRRKKPNRYKNKPAAIFYSRYLLKKTIIDLIMATPVLAEGTKKSSVPKGFWAKPTASSKLNSTIHYNLPTQFYSTSGAPSSYSEAVANLRFATEKRHQAFSKKRQTPTALHKKPKQPFVNRRLTAPKVPESAIRRTK